MKKLLNRLLIVFLITGVIAIFISFKIGDTEKNQMITQTSSTDEYPQELRDIPDAEEEINEEVAVIEPEEEVTKVEEPKVSEEIKEIEETEEIEEDTENIDEEEVLEEEEEEPKQTLDDLDPTMERVRVLTEKVNIRREPSTQGKIITVLYYDDVGVVLEKGESWSKVRIYDYEGYISNKCMEFIPPN